MVLNIDTSRALRSPAQLQDLVRAVIRASPGDESRAVEWKSGYSSLTEPDAAFAIARAVLGLANRTVIGAASTFEGVGYVIVGAEPGRLRAQSIPDSAELTQAIGRYTGPGTPVWDGRPVDVDGTIVLVVTVEAPRPGDRIALLHRAHQHNKTMTAEGTIFVRRGGLTERAARVEIEALQDRLLAGSNAEATARAEDLRAVRRAVLDGVRAADRWTSALEVVVIATASDRWTDRDFGEWANTDSGRQASTDAQTMKQSALQLRLLTTDGPLLRSSVEVDAALEDKDAFNGIYKLPSTGEDRARAYQHLNRVRTAWARIEREAMTLPKV